MNDSHPWPLVDWKERLDKHGFFFQKKVQLVVEHALGKIAEDEVPSRAGPTGKETQIDFRVSVEGAASPAFELVFECKKTYDKEWLFLMADRDSSSFRSIWLRQVIEPVPDEGDRLSSFYEFTADALKLGADQTHEICEYGFEAERTKDTAETDSVRDAARQVSVGLHQFLTEARATAPRIEKVFRGSNPTHAAALPLVVTNGPILQGRYDPEQVDMSSGQINKDAFSVRERDWLVYRFHAPQDLVFMEFPESMVGTDGMEEDEISRHHASLVRKASKIDMFIVKATALPGFLHKLMVAISAPDK